MVGNTVDELSRRFVRAEEVYTEDEKALGVRMVSTKTCTECNMAIHSGVAMLKEMGEEAVLAELTIAAAWAVESRTCPGNN